jgi:hypothetical protein
MLFADAPSRVYFHHDEEQSKQALWIGDVEVEEATGSIILMLT